jgi:homoserine kinase
MTPSIKVFAPASVANLACGFDVLGLAIHGVGDEILAREVSTPGLTITEITGAQGKITTDPLRNTATIAAQALLDHLGITDRGFEFRIRKKMPIGSGLGSSAASAVAGVYAINCLLRNPLEKKDLLPFALDGEAFASGSRHLDNVAPCLLGGIRLVRDTATYDVHRIYAPQGLQVVVVYPEITLLTKDARGILSPTVTMPDMIAQTANIGALVLGLETGNFELISRALRDVVIEPQRAHLIPHFYDVQEAAMRFGALGCSISGAGPSIFALCKSSHDAEQAGTAMQAVYEAAKIKSTLYISEINHEGVILH